MRGSLILLPILALGGCAPLHIGHAHATLGRVCIGGATLIALHGDEDSGDYACMDSMGNGTVALVRHGVVIKLRPAEQYFAKADDAACRRAGFAAGSTDYTTCRQRLADKRKAGRSAMPSGFR